MKYKLLLVVLLLSSSLFASNDNYPMGGRSAGIGHASVTLSDVWSTHHNQAGLAYLENISAGVFYENRFLLKELGVQGGVLALPTKGGTFGISMSSFGYSLYNEGKYGLAYGRKLSDKVAAGVQLNYLTTRIGENYGNTSALAVEAGLQAQLSKELSIGAHIYNPNRAKVAAFNDERIPTIMRIGLNYTFSEKVFVVAETQKDIDYPANFKAGVEYRVVEVLYLRAGVSTGPVLNTFGFGLNLKQFRLDIASSYHSVLGYSPHVSLTYNVSK